MQKSVFHVEIVTLLALGLIIALGGGAWAEPSPSGEAPPRVVQVYPSEGMTDVPVESGIHIIFSKPMEPKTAIQAINITPSPVLIYPASYQFMNNDTVLAIIPARPLKYETTYIVTIGSGAQDTSGNELGGAVSWSFSTEKSPPPPGELPKNGDFETGILQGWTWRHKEAKGQPEAKVSVVRLQGNGHAVRIWRDPNFDLGVGILEQTLNVDVPAYGLVYLSFDILLGPYTNKVYSPERTYPARVIVTYTDRQGREYSFTRSYYYYPPSEGGLDSSAEFVELGKWSTRSYNLGMLTPRPARLKSIRFECAGWGWETYLDNIRVVW